MGAAFLEDFYVLLNCSNFSYMHSCFLSSGAADIAVFADPNIEPIALKILDFYYCFIALPELFMAILPLLLLFMAMLPLDIL